jgi:hypothetical protein
MQKVWFITGCSTGFGRYLAVEALAKGYNVVVECPSCKNWNSEYRSKRRCDRCQDTRVTNGKYIPKRSLPRGGNDRFKFNLKDVGFVKDYYVRSSNTGYNYHIGGYWTSDEDKSIYERGPYCFVIGYMPDSYFPDFSNFTKKYHLFPLRLVKNK